MHSRLKILLYISLFAVLLEGCVTARKVNYLQEPSKSIPSYNDTLGYEDYVLRKGDRLYIHVYSIDPKISSLFNGGISRQNYNFRSSNDGNSDLYTYVVDDEGNIQFPTLDKVYVRGLTSREVKHLLEDKLSGLIVNYGNRLNLSVEVQVVQRYFSVIGVNQSGRFLINKEKVTIYEALAQAGDIADFGDRHVVHIIREGEDSTKVMTFDVRSKDVINSEFYYIEPNDVIYIQQMRGKAFGINSAGAAVSVTAATLSFGVFIYTLVDRFIIRPTK